MLADLLPRAIEATGGEVSDLVIEIKGNLGHLQGPENRPEDGMRMLQEVLEAQRTLYGPEDERIARTLINMGAICIGSLQLYDEAEALMTEALETRRRLFGDDHPAVASALANLCGAVHYTKGVEAEVELLRGALEIQERRLVPGHYETARSRGALGVALLRLGRHAEADPLISQAIAELDDKPPGRAVRASGLRRHLAESLMQQERFAEAEAVLHEAMHRAQTRFAHTTEPNAIARRFVRLYDAWGRPEMAALWQARAAQD
jgi:tetratricopeptide (TPR) repeat protein